MQQKNYQSVWEDVAEGVAKKVSAKKYIKYEKLSLLKAGINKFFKENPIELERLFEMYNQEYAAQAKFLVSSLSQDIKLYLKNQSCLPNSTYSQYDDAKSNDPKRPFFYFAEDAEIEQLIQHTWLGLLAMTVNYRARGQSSVANVLASNKNNRLDQFSIIDQKLLGSESNTDPNYNKNTSLFIFNFLTKIIQEDKETSSPYLPTLIVAVGTGDVTLALLYFTSTSFKTTAISSILVGGICAFATYKYIDSLNQYINEYNKRGEDLRNAISNNVEQDAAKRN